jgi:eukaryotic-like serine/threonine-protein kinase
MRLSNHTEPVFQWSEGHTFIGGYRVLEQLGAGGMAEVFAARASGTDLVGTLVAIKRIRPEITQDEEAISILFDEALKAQRLTHPAICEILELGHVGESHFIAMELLRGWNLEQLGARLRGAGRRLPMVAAIHVALEICGALDHAHRADLPGETTAGVIHWGLIPQNVFVTFCGDVKVCDFAIGRAVASLLHGRTRILKRGYGYLAPEQVRGQAVDRRADLFSLGAILYELLTGERAFRGENDLATLDKIRRGELAPPSALRPEVSPELDRVVAAALAVDPGGRHASARELGRALHCCLAGLDEAPGDLESWLAEAFGPEIAVAAERLEALGAPLEGRRPSAPAAGI